MSIVSSARPAPCVLDPSWVWTMTEMFDFSWTGNGASRALMVPLEQIDMPTDQLRNALPRLARSPLYGLMTDHIVELFEAAGAVTDHPFVDEIATASTDLARALISSLSGDPER